MNYQIIWFKSHSGQFGIFLLEMKLKNWLKSIIYTTCSRLNGCSSGKDSNLDEDNYVFFA